MHRVYLTKRAIMARGAAQEREVMSASRGGGFARVTKWIGVATALLSFGTAVYGLLRAEGDLRERRRVVSEQLSAGREHQKAGDYPVAWNSLQTANAAAQVDGMFAKLLGGLSGERQRARTAQEDLAMEWIQKSRIKEGETFADLSDKLVNVLAAGAASATGVRKADLLAHLGWAYFLKYRSGDFNVKPEVAYREAVAADAGNPYANVFWGHWILWNHGPIREANERFDAALSTDRARAAVRTFQLAAFTNSHSDDYEAAWVRVVDDMRVRGERISTKTWHDLYGLYYFAFDDPSLLRSMLDGVPPDRQLALEHELLRSGELTPAQKLVTKGVAGLTLEAASKKEEALVAWRELLAEVSGDPRSTLNDSARAAIKRLSRTTPH